jgi:hypothetical protein
MTFVMGGGKRTSNCKNKNNSKNKSLLGDGIHSHLRRDKTAPKMGHPNGLDCLEETTATARTTTKVTAAAWL